MAVKNRAAKLAKLHKVARKLFQPVTPPEHRSVLDHMLYACCLEDSTFDKADVAFARLQEGFFDWNEVRVTTAVELAEIMDCLTDPAQAATRLKKTLHSMFEANYTFDIDNLRKENLGKAVQKIAEYNGISQFVVSYVAQNGLGGHYIGVDLSLINLMYTIGVIDEKEAEAGSVPGMERAIPKNKGVEFFSCAHQLAVKYSTSPFNNDVRAILTGIDPEAKERFPKRNRKKVVQPEPEPPVEEVVETKEKTKAKAGKAGKAGKTVAAKDAKKTAGKKEAKKAPVKKKAPAKKKVAAKPAKASKKKVAKKAPAKKKKATKPAAAKKKTAKKKPAKKKATGKSTKTTSRRLAKKKPR